MSFEPQFPATPPQAPGKPPIRRPTGQPRFLNGYKIYGSGENEVRALNGVTVGFPKADGSPP
ncbi:MAG: hypothetical protein R2735_05685 [Microthrixaceae bacterium]